MSRLSRRLGLLVLFACLSIPGAVGWAQNTWYVDDDAPGDPGPGDPAVSDPLEDGSDDHPFDAIQAAIDASTNGDTILVAAGAYAGAGNRDLDFAGRSTTLRSASGEIDCTIDCQGTSAEPHRGFVFHTAETADAVVDGFRIINGWAQQGGGMYVENASPTVSNCILESNVAVRGGGLYDTGSTMLVTRCTFRWNQAVSTSMFTYGSGAYNDGGNPTMTECLFLENASLGPYPTDYGGGLRNYYGDAVIRKCQFIRNSAHCSGGVSNAGGNPVFSHCVFAGNTATISGGGIGHGSNGAIVNCLFVGNKLPFLTPAGQSTGGAIFVGSNAPLISQCTFSGNTADSGGAVSGWGGAQPAIRNSILWGNTRNEIGGYIAASVSISFSIVPGGGDGEGNLDADPLFVRPPSPGLDGEWGTADDDYGDLHVRPESPCRDAGSNTAVPADVLDLDADGDTSEPMPFDMDGLPRIAWCAVDMGACEHPGPFADLDDDCDVDVEDYVQFESCLAASGPGTPSPAHACLAAFDFDADSDLDLSDVAVLEMLLGQHVPAPQAQNLSLAISGRTEPYARWTNSHLFPCLSVSAFPRFPATAAGPSE